MRDRIESNIRGPLQCWRCGRMIGPKEAVAMYRAAGTDKLKPQHSPKCPAPEKKA